MTHTVDAGMLAVAFGPHCVTVHSSAPDAIDQLRRIFHWMPACGDETALADVEIVRTAGGYRGRAGDTEAEVASLADFTRWAQYQIIERFIAARDDLVWLHAAAAGLDGVAVLLPGRRGQGKSTLVARLWERGWDFLTDDILPLDPQSLHVLPFPQMPAVRAPQERILSDEELAAVEKATVFVTGRVARTAVPVGAVVLPVAEAGCTADLVPCSLGEAVLRLLEGCWNFAEQGENAVARICALVPHVSTQRLTYGDADAAADRLTRWAAERFVVRRNHTGAADR